MFGKSKFKEEIRELKDRVSELEFTIKNPPKYKIGDKIKSGPKKGEVVVFVEIRWHYRFVGYFSQKAYPEYWVYDSIKINK